EADASGFGIGAVLLQNKRAIAYFSQVLGPQARLKSVYERELMAIVLAIRKWRPYLLGRKFIVRTDQRSLKYLLEKRLVSEEHQRWLSKLVEDPKLAALSIPWVIDWQELGRLVIPRHSPWIPKLFYEFHNSVVGGHSGALKTQRRMAKEVYWVGMKKDVEKLVADSKTVAAAFLREVAHTERRFVSLDMSIRAYRLEEDERHEEEDRRHEERIRRYDELKNLLLSLIQKSSSPSPVQSSRPITTKVPTKPTECAPSYGDFGCLSPNNMTDFEEDEKEFENTILVAKEDKDEQGKEEKGVVKFFEVGTDEENNSDIVFNDVGRIVYGKGNDTWADAGLKHGSYFLFDRIPEDGWYFHDESRLSKKPLCRSNLEVHLQFHVDRLETGSQVKTWDPGIKFVRSNTLRTRYGISVLAITVGEWVGDLKEAASDPQLALDTQGVVGGGRRDTGTFFLTLRNSHGQGEHLAYTELFYIDQVPGCNKLSARTGLLFLEEVLGCLLKCERDEDSLVVNRGLDYAARTFSKQMNLISDHTGDVAGGRLAVRYSQRLSVGEVTYYSTISLSARWCKESERVGVLDVGVLDTAGDMVLGGRQCDAVILGRMRSRGEQQHTRKRKANHEAMGYLNKDKIGCGEVLYGRQDGNWDNDGGHRSGGDEGVLVGFRVLMRGFLFFRDWSGCFEASLADAKGDDSVGALVGVGTIPACSCMRSKEEDELPEKDFRDTVIVVVDWTMDMRLSVIMSRFSVRRSGEGGVGEQEEAL
ncbi:putative mitochondrial protein, partial [Tanacetum coccineum]